MAAQTYAIEFKGYWREPKKGGVPEQSGVYCVYTCVYNTQANTVSLQKLIYIGEAEDVHSRISNHDKQEDWESHLKSGEQFCYSFGPVPTASRERCEAALIFEHKPPVNTEYIDAFPFDQTTLNLSGEIGKLHTPFTVYRS
ncbi:MAG: GIY-YIG nuclease family protein [Anaerolineaceae bacterium]|jgi:excinuclease UvrABC nuclease subunit